MSTERRWFSQIDPAAAVDPPTGMWKIVLTAVAVLGLALRIWIPSAERRLVVAIGRAR